MKRHICGAQQNQKAWARQGFSTLRADSRFVKWLKLRELAESIPQGWPETMPPKPRPIFPLEIKKFWREAHGWLRFFALLAVGGNILLFILWAYYKVCPPVS